MKEVHHLVRVPKVFLNETKQKIMEELKAQDSSEYVGSSDVLLAWWYKVRSPSFSPMMCNS